MALRRRDLEGVLAFLGDAHGVDAPEALTTALLDRLAELVGCEFATYQTFDWPRRRVTAYVACSNEGPDAVPPPYVPESFWRAEKPPHWTDAALHKLSDACQRRERERIGDEGAFNAEFRTVDTLGFRVGDRRTRSAWLHFDSQSRDFGEREREIALTLRPHLETLWRKALVRRQVAELVEGVGRKPDGSPAQAILLFETDGHIETRPARRGGCSVDGSEPGTAGSPATSTNGRRSRVREIASR